MKPTSPTSAHSPSPLDYCQGCSYLAIQNCRALGKAISPLVLAHCQKDHLRITEGPRVHWSPTGVLNILTVTGWITLGAKIPPHKPAE